MKALNEAPARHTARRAKELQRPVLAIHDTTSSLKWWRGIEETERQLNCGNVIHVGDRESDAYELMPAA
jgi:hypothetical protein